MKTQDRNAMLGVRIHMYICTYVRDRRSADAPVPPTEGLSSFVRFVDNEVVLLLCPLPGTHDHQRSRLALARSIRLPPGGHQTRRLGHAWIVRVAPTVVQQLHALPQRFREQL